MKKLKFAALGLALVFACCSAFTTTSTTKSGDQLYGVTGSDPNNYDVTPITGSYRCSQSANICTVTADPADVMNGVVPKTEAQIKELGDFQAL
jgi:hypothetical protein